MNARLQPRLERRAMNTRDLAAVLDIETQAYSHPWTRGNFIDSLAAGYEAWLLTEDAQPVGYFVAMAGVDELHLLSVTVTPSRQGQGLGNLLLDDVHALARAQGLPRVLLEVRPSNQRARALYARRGYLEIGLRRGYYPAAGGREDALVLAHDLDALHEARHGLD
jgi:[ribosomal protein S18]-alanine N-acetyltransferase